MSISVVIRPVGKTLMLSVANTAAADTVPLPDEPTNYAAFLNTGTTRIAFTMVSQGAGQNPPVTAPTAVEAVAGTPTRTVELPASMTMPMIVAVPGFPLNVNAIGSAAGPALLFITPVAAQS